MKILNIAICIVFIIGYVFSYEINILKENYESVNITITNDIFDSIEKTYTIFLN